MRNLNVAELAAKVVEGSRGHVARAITLVESTKPEHRAQAHELLQLINPHTGKAFRVGISGVPGAGKSTFINAMGIKLIEKHHHQVAVLAVDPSSTRTGGSILGDRTRMGDLAMRDEAFIRPSPSAGHLGGVARATRESMLVLEAAGYDVVLQGIKRGILELADVISITKADGDNEGEARVSARELSIAMKLISSDESRRRPPVLTCSSYTGAGLDDVWEAVTKHRADLEKAGELVGRRQSQQRAWLWNMVEQEIIQSLRTSPEVREVAARVEADLAAEKISAVEGSTDILETFARTFGHPATDATAG